MDGVQGLPSDRQRGCTYLAVGSSQVDAASGGPVEHKGAAAPQVNKRRHAAIQITAIAGAIGAIAGARAIGAIGAIAAAVEEMHAAISEEQNHRQELPQAEGASQEEAV